jgi:hypothetical protein
VGVRGRKRACVGICGGMIVCTNVCGYAYVPLDRGACACCGIVVLMLCVIMSVGGFCVTVRASVCVCAVVFGGVMVY